MTSSNAVLHDFDCVVVGAGPAGVSAVLALRALRSKLDRPISVCWVDPQFSVGRLDSYRAVPANTKLDILLGPKMFGHELMMDIRASSPQVEKAIQNLAQSGTALEGHETFDSSHAGWCSLGRCRDVYDAVTTALFEESQSTREVKSPKMMFSLRLVYGTVLKMTKDHHGSLWTLDIDRTSVPQGKCGLSQLLAPCSVTAQFVVWATGSYPTEGTLLTDTPILPLDAALNPERLKIELKSTAPEGVVGVVGNSHSAMIAIANLKEAGVQQVINFARRPARCAVWDSEIKNYRYTSSGLKGFGSWFARGLRLHTQTPTMARSSHSESGEDGGSAERGASWLRVLHVDALSDDAVLGKLRAIIYAIGYSPNLVPTLQINGCSIEPHQHALARDDATSALWIPGATGLDYSLFGLGIAWPELPGHLWGVGFENEEGFSRREVCRIPSFL